MADEILDPGEAEPDAEAPAIWEVDTTEFDAIRIERMEPESPEPGGRSGRFRAAEAPDEGARSGVTASADWGFDEDPESYSAPV